jgi:hypothetical protein
MSISLKSEDLNNSVSLIGAINRNYYPSGQAVVVNTSRNQDGIYGDTLTSRTLTEVLSGDAFYQDPRYSIAANAKAANSSLNSLLTGGAQAAFYADIKAVEEGQELEVKDGDRTITVSGVAAFQQALGNTNVISKNLGGDISSRALSVIANATGAAYIGSLENARTVSGSNGHINADYISDVAAYSGGSRTIVIKDVTIDDEEFTWLYERLDLLHQMAVSGIVHDHSAIKNGFPFDVPNNIGQSSATKSYYPGLDGVSSAVDNSIIQLPVKTAYICPTLIEFLHYISSDNSSIRITGGLGVWRANSPNNQGPNLSKGGKSLSDHVFGRAFDIATISSSDGSMSVNLKSEGSNADRHREALYALLEAMDNMAIQAPYLLPDLIVCSPDLATELGVTDGLEPDNAPVKVRFRNLKYLNFYTDDNHRSHIHVSWSAARSGIYSGPGGVLSAPSFEWIDGGTGLGESGWTGGMGLSDDEAQISPETLAKFTKSYATGTDPGKLDLQEIFDLLRSTVFSAEASAIFCAVVVRESGGVVRSINPNIDTGDWSIGLFQLNLLTNANGRHDFYMPEGNVARKGWQLGYANYAAEGITVDNFNQKVTSLYQRYGTQDRSVYFPLLDPLLWIPINQASMCYTVAKGGGMPPQNMTPSDKLGYSPETGYIFRPWGDYGSHEYGFIRGVRFYDAVSTYVRGGGKASDLKDWTLEMFNTSGSGSRVKPFAPDWVDGWFFPVNGGPPEKRDIINYNTGSGGTSTYE